MVRAAAGHIADATLIGEPTGLTLGHAGTGVVWPRLTAVGTADHAAHAGREGPFDHLAAAVAALRSLEADLNRDADRLHLRRCLGLALRAHHRAHRRWRVDLVGSLGAGRPGTLRLRPRSFARRDPARDPSAGRGGGPRRPRRLRRVPCARLLSRSPPARFRRPFARRTAKHSVPRHIPVSSPQRPTLGSSRAHASATDPPQVGTMAGTSGWSSTHSRRPQRWSRSQPSVGLPEREPRRSAGRWPPRHRRSSRRHDFPMAATSPTVNRVSG